MGIVSAISWSIFAENVLRIPFFCYFKNKMPSAFGSPIASIIDLRISMVIHSRRYHESLFGNIKVITLEIHLAIVSDFFLKIFFGNNFKLFWSFIWNFIKQSLQEFLYDNLCEFSWVMKFFGHFPENSFTIFFLVFSSVLFATTA